MKALQRVKLPRQTGLSTCGVHCALFRSASAQVVGAQHRPLAQYLRKLTSTQAAYSSRDSSIVARVMATAAPEAPAAVTAIDENLNKLRELMLKADGGKGVHAYIVPTEDPHMSEYAPDCFKRREFISKFTGSAGTVVVTLDKAALWTDGRYFLQGEKELGKDWQLMRAGTPGCPEIEDWLASTLPEGGRVGIDPFCHTVDSVRRLQKKLEASGKSLVPLLADGNLVDGVWGAARPEAPPVPIRVHPMEWAGQSVQDKLQMLRGRMAAAKADALLVTMLDEVAWLLNLRGSDVPFNPVFISYAMVGKEGATLYTQPGKVTEQVAQHLKEAGVQVKEYDQMVEDVRSSAAAGSLLWADPSKVSYALYMAAQPEAAAGGSAAAAAVTSPRGPRGKKRKATADAPASPAAAPAPAAPKLVEQLSPIAAAKALKNEAELAGMREAHLRDAAAICEFICWFEKQVASGRVFTEVEVDLELTGRRKQQQGFIEPSFPTIAGAGPNGAIIHYRAQEPDCGKVDSSTMLLVDSGGQYDCGTTDITRTFHFGTPSAHQKRCYTRVLQGHIGLDRAVFPEGTPGLALDTLARMPLWSEGLNYRHGTGHGVGAALNVHEGPHSISSRYHITVPLEATMVCSNEPGYYEEGGFGIRVENLVVVKEVDTEFRYGGQQYYGFDKLTLVPMATNLVEPSLLSPQEEAWLDDYHAQVYEQVAPRVSGEVLEWLKAATRPLKEQLAAAKP